MQRPGWVVGASDVQPSIDKLECPPHAGLAAAGSAEALGLLLESYRNFLLSVAEAELDSALRVKAGASDLVQRTFLEAYRDFANFRGQTREELQAWLRRMLLNNLADHIRGYRQSAKRAVGREVPLAEIDWQGDGAVPIVDPGSSPSRGALRHEARQRLDAALARLPEHYQQVIRLRHHEQLDFRTIGTRLGRSTDAARKIWARAIEQLRREFEHETARST